MTAKSISIKHRVCRSGGRAVKAVELTSGGLRRAVGPGENTRRARLTIPQGEAIAPEKSAEGVVVRAVTRNGRVPIPASTG